ncbi:MAG: hypothetical protein RJA22_2272 [Verrucomicrobiota bacterium]|jgi:hydroxypyruvate isomerase
MSTPLSRRSALGRLAGGAAVAAAAASLQTRLGAAEAAVGPALKGRIRHSVCKWCYPKVSLEELCVAGKAMGLESIELLNPSDFPTLKKHGLTCAMVNGPFVGPNRIGRIEKAWNRVEHHDLLVPAYEQRIREVAEAGLTHVICFSGNRDGLADEKGLENCALGLQRLMPAAEKAKVTVVMELLNSRVDHRDYMCDKSAWGVELCRRIGSERFKLLFDIYHMQIMEGDIIATIRKHHASFAHYHTGGVPGRAEIDDSQEIHYPAIMRAIAETGFKGHVAQEFIPKRPDALASLRQGVGLCDV